MTSATTPFPPREPTLAGQTVIVIGGSAGIGSRQPGARAEGLMSSSPAVVPTLK